MTGELCLATIIYHANHFPFCSDIVYHTVQCTVGLHYNAIFSLFYPATKLCCCHYHCTHSRALVVSPPLVTSRGRRSITCGIQVVGLSMLGAAELCGQHRKVCLFFLHITGELQVILGVQAPQFKIITNCMATEPQLFVVAS